MFNLGKFSQFFIIFIIIYFLLQKNELLLYLTEIFSFSSEL